MRSYASLEAIYEKPVNYATESQLIGDSVNQAIQENRDRETHNIETKRKKALLQRERMQMAQLQQAQLETLQIPADTNIPSADQYYQEISRKLVDQQAGLVAQLQRGDISTDEFAQASAQIKNQIPAIKAGKEALTGFQGNYQKLLQDNALSNANDGMAADLYDSITNGTLKIEPDENGEVRMYDEERGINMPLSAIDRIPQPVPRAQEIGVEVAPVVERLQDAVSWGEDQDESVRLHLDSLLQGNDVQNNKTLEAIAVDALDIPLEEARKLANTAPESDEHQHTNRLEELVEDRMINEARTQWGNNQAKRNIDQQKALLLQEQQRAARARAAQSYSNARGGGGAAVKLTKINQQAQKFVDIRNKIAEMGDLNNPSNTKQINELLKGMSGGKIQTIHFTPQTDEVKGRWPWSDDTPAKAQTFTIVPKGGKGAYLANWDELLSIVGREHWGPDSPL